MLSPAGDWPAQGTATYDSSWQSAVGVSGPVPVLPHFHATVPQHA